MAYASFSNANITTQFAGMIVRAGAAPGDALLALADSLPNIASILGVRQEDVLAGANGRIGGFAEPGTRVRMDAAPAIGNIIYLSDSTPGVGTITPPLITAPLGICYEVAVIAGVNYASITPIGSSLPPVPSEIPYTPASGAQVVTIDCGKGDVHVVTGNAAGTAITFAVANSINSQCFIVVILQGAVVSTISAWFATVRWAGGSPPTLTAVVGKRDTFGFRRTGANTYDGFIVGQNC